MSVVVRMEMPKSCKKCKSTICLLVKDDDLDYMDVIEKVKDFRKKNNDVGFPDFCPIICQLPEGHGRLVDGEKLKAKKYHSNITNENAVAVAEIDWAETIVPAEEKPEPPKEDA